jgi:hypothetical protein
MTDQPYDKGKIFTNVVSKDAVQATIQTVTNRVHGSVYVRPGVRIKDELTQADKFIAVTDATVYDTQNKELYRTCFLVVNRDHIIWLIPDEDLVNEQDWIKERPDD